MNRVDLHLHTSLSDGLMTPEDVVALAKQNECKIVAITDHELSSNFEQLEKKYDINIIPGIEFNTSVSNLHLLGYGITDFEKLDKKMTELRKLNEVICIEVIEKLRNDGFDVSVEKLKEYLYKTKLDCNILDKRKLVKYLMHMGYSSSIVDTYNKLIGKGQKYYISNIKLHPKEIIELVGLCGGRTVLAHPNTITNNNEELQRYISELKDYGLFGIEVINSKMKLNQTEYYQYIAKRFNLLETFGSDFHNPTSDCIGLEIDSEKLEKIYDSLVLKKRL